MLVRLVFSFTKLHPGAVLGIFIWVGQSKAKQILGRPTEVVYVGIKGMTCTVCVGQERIWIGHGLPGLIARTAAHDISTDYVTFYILLLLLLLFYCILTVLM